MDCKIFFLTAVILFCITYTPSLISLSSATVDTSFSIAGKPFKNISECTNTSHYVSPQNIHVLMMGSKKYLQRYQFQVQTIQEYCKLHGYNFLVQDPKVVLQVVGTIPSDGGKFSLIASKPLIIHYHMRELFHKYECEAKWLFFVDADTVMVDLTRSLESVISYANHQYYPMGAKGGRGDEGCELIAQLSSSTINAGAIFFRISPASDELVRTWIQTHLEYKALGRQWQLDQGWFQYTYLRHLGSLYDIRWPLDCAAGNIHIGTMKENAVRSKCFATLLYLTGLMPLPHHPHILYQPHRVAAIVNKFNRKEGRDHNISKGVRFCVMAGLTTEDRFNPHDWNTELLQPASPLPLMVESTQIPAETQMSDDELKLTLIRYVQSGTNETAIRSSCTLDHLLLYHGRDKAIIAFLQRTFQRNLLRAKKLMALAAESKLVFQYANGSKAHSQHPPSDQQKVTSFHLFQCNISGVCIVPSHSDISNRVTGHEKELSCEHEIAAALGTAGSNLQWIATSNFPKGVDKLAHQLERKRLQLLG